MTNAPHLACHGVDFAHGPTPVLEGVEVEISQGEWIGLIGGEAVHASIIPAWSSGDDAPGSLPVWYPAGLVGARGPRFRPHWITCPPWNTSLRTTALPPSALPCRRPPSLPAFTSPA